MTKQRRRELIGLTAVASLTLLALVPAGIAAAATTRSESPAAYPSLPGRFYSVTATSANDVWAVGLGAAGGQIAHWNGSSWAGLPVQRGLPERVGTVRY